jgi:hypothetical protein
MLSELMRSRALAECDPTQSEVECDPNAPQFKIEWQNAYFMNWQYVAAQHTNIAAEYHRITAFVARVGGPQWTFQDKICRPANNPYGLLNVSDCLGSWDAAGGCNSGIGPLNGSSVHYAEYVDWRQYDVTPKADPTTT